jgi:hypothetical protein
VGTETVLSYLRPALRNESTLREPTVRGEIVAGSEIVAGNADGEVVSLRRRVHPLGPVVGDVRGQGDLGGIGRGDTLQRESPHDHQPGDVTG